jgi:hypothetical protein
MDEHRKFAQADARAIGERIGIDWETSRAERGKIPVHWFAAASVVATLRRRTVPDGPRG